MAMGPSGDNPFSNRYSPFPGLFDNPFWLGPYGSPPFPPPFVGPPPRPHAPLKRDHFVAQAVPPEAEENTKSGSNGAAWFAKEVFKTGLTVGASILGGLFGGAPGAIAAGATASGAVNIADQLLGKRKEGEHGIDWGSVLLDMSLGLLPGGIGEMAVRTGEKAFAGLTGKKLASKTSKLFFRRVMLEGALDGAAMGYVGGVLQSGYSDYKEKGKLDLSKVNQEGLNAVLPGMVGGAAAGGMFTALSREIHRGSQSRSYEKTHETALTPLRESLGHAEPIRMTWRQRLSSMLFERSEDEVIRNFHKVDDRLYRGAMPESYGALHKLKEDHGIRTIIDLRGEGGERMQQAREFEKKCAEHLGMQYVHINMSASQAPGEGQLRDFLNAVRQSDGKVYVHCQQGIDRTGALVAAYELAKGGKDQKQAYRDMKKHGYNWIHEQKYPAQRKQVLDQNFPTLVRRANLHTELDDLLFTGILSDDSKEYQHIRELITDNQLDRAAAFVNWRRNNPQAGYTLGHG